MDRKKCAVRGCTSKGKRLRSFPKEKERCLKWVAACANPELVKKVLKNQYICDIHFEDRFKLSTRLSMSSVPTLHLPEPVDAKQQLETLQQPVAVTPEAHANTRQIKIEIKMEEEQYDSVFTDHFEVHEPENICGGGMEVTAGPSTETNMLGSRNVEMDENILRTPNKNRQPRYPGDVKIPNVEDMTTTSIRRSLDLLTTACKKKDVVIRRLRSQNHWQKKKIEKLQNLLDEFRRNGVISANVNNFLKSATDGSSSSLMKRTKT